MSTSDLIFMCRSGKIKPGLYMKLYIQSLFGLLCTAELIGWNPATNPPSPRTWANIHTRALLVSQDRRNLFVTPYQKLSSPLPANTGGTLPAFSVPVSTVGLLCTVCDLTSTKRGCIHGHKNRVCSSIFLNCCLMTPRRQQISTLRLQLSSFQLL